MKIYIYNENIFLDTLKYAKLTNHKITFSSVNQLSDSHLFSITNPPVRCLGNGIEFENEYQYDTLPIHCVNKMEQIIEINTINNYMVVEGGITWLKIIMELDKIGYTICSCQSGLIFSVAGSICVNAHGRSTKTPMIIDTVLFIEFINGKGEKQTVFPKDEIFYAICGSMGLLGFITRISLKIKKNYYFSQEFYVETFENKELTTDKNNVLQTLKKILDIPEIEMLNIRFGVPNKREHSQFNTTNNALKMDCTPPTEVLINLHRRCKKKTNGGDIPPMNIYKYHQTETSRVFYTFCVLIVYFLCYFSCFDKLRWEMEKRHLQTFVVPECKNINDTFEVWGVPYLNNFKIIEFFFPQEHFFYCQSIIFKIFETHGVKIISSGSRFIFQRGETPEGKLRGLCYGIHFSRYATRENPYLSLTMNFFIENNDPRMFAITNDIRRYIIYKNIHFAYHTAYSWNFTREDIKYMFPCISKFAELKQQCDPSCVFSNLFYEKYLSS